MKNDCLDVQTPVGVLRVTAQDGGLKSVSWINKKTVHSSDNPVLKQAAKELREYFSGLRVRFTVPLRPEGTIFQKAVWKTCRRIPFGKTRTYGALAESAGSPGAARAAGSAMAANPLPVFVPCHRVVPNNGGIGRYSGGRGVETKQKLLELEKQ